MTAGACSSNSPTAVRELGAERGTSDASSTVPRTPSTTPSVMVSPSTWCRKAKRNWPRSAACFARAANGATRPGPVPQVMWKRGTELP